ncbi:universal stress protein [Sphaerisporangium melleum]|uniref:universal stress protein n=1 Tax=Sphaerisporangium melleum TaxID=321316 RepID=UPI0036D2597A
MAGVDGSPAGLVAVRWAAREAALREVSLRLVNAMPAWACEPGPGPYAEVARWMRDGADAALREAAEQAREEVPRAEVALARLAGDPRPALIEAAREAELLVVGNHGIGGFRGLLVGSVALGVAGRARCPVAVVRALPRQARPLVVAGVDGGGRDAETVRFAFAEAWLRRAELLVVRASGGPPGPDDEQEGEGPLVALRESRERHPEVKVGAITREGHPVEVLSRESARAEVLVVGSRGRGGFAGLVLGSVGHALLHHAPCPVIVLPRPSED